MTEVSESTAIITSVIRVASEALWTAEAFRAVGGARARASPSGHLLRARLRGNPLHLVACIILHFGHKFLPNLAILAARTACEILPK
jgi:hypothetical protein